MRHEKLVVLVAFALLLVLGLPETSRGTDFAAPKSYPVGTAPAFIVTGDFNGDGKMDIAVGNAGSNDVSILLGNGDGTFKTALHSRAGLSPQQMVVGDFNGDGKLDLVVSNSGDGAAVLGVLNILLGKGDGTFQAPATIAADKYPAQLAVADFNEDQKPDLVVGDLKDGGVTLLLGKGDGTFQVGTVILASTDGVTAITVADFNGDKHLDVVVGVPVISTNLVGLALSQLSGKGDGTFQPSQVITTLGFPFHDSETVSSPHLVLGDFNGDGNLDFALRYQFARKQVPPYCGYICQTTRTDRVVVFSGKGDGTFNAEAGVLGLDGWGGGNLSVGDFNADNKLDFLVPRHGLGFLELGRGDGTFLALTQEPPLWTGLGNFAAAADLNGDKLPDAIVTDTANNAIVVLLNTSPASGSDLGVILDQTQINATIGAGDISYTATVLNTGPQDATGVALKESLPAGLKLVSASLGTCTGTTTITCDLGAMADPSSAVVTFTVTPISPGTLMDALQVSGSQPDLNSKNNSASLTVTAVLPADISVSSMESTGTAALGDKVTFKVTVSNAGPGTATTVVLTQALSADFPISALTTSQGNCMSATANITCTLGMLASGAKVTISFAITMQSAGTFVTSSSVTEDQPDLNPGDNGTSQSVAVSPTDLSVTQMASATTVAIGGQVMFKLTVTNKGPNAASNVTLTDNLNAATFPAATASQGSCSAPEGSGFTCALGSLAASATATVTFPATFLSVGQVANNVSVSSDGPDPDTSNNSASVNINVTQTPDFSVTPASPTLTVTHGSVASEVLSFTSQGGLASTLALTCVVTGTAPLPPCGLQPTSVTLGPNPVTSTLTVDTSSLSAALVVAPTNAYDRGFYAMVLPLWLIIGAASRRNQKQRRRWLMTTVFLVAAILPVACGGSQQQVQFQTKTFTVTVQAKDSAGPTSHSTVITLTVQ